ncbi:hypothetical protein PMAYCL1PPCAC_16146, partial [Pristionchus mayeri]
MEVYVACLLEAIDVGSETLDWNELLEKYSDDYDKFEPILRDNFRILNRELIRKDGTKVYRPRSGPTDIERLSSGPFSIEEKFNASVEIMRSLPNRGLLRDLQSLSQGGIQKLGPFTFNFSQLFTLYALYKQATIGPCNTRKPFFSLVKRYKWDAWKRLGDTTK